MTTSKTAVLFPLRGRRRGEHPTRFDVATGAVVGYAPETPVKPDGRRAINGWAVRVLQGWLLVYATEAGLVAQRGRTIVDVRPGGMRHRRVVFYESLTITDENRSIHASRISLAGPIGMVIDPTYDGMDEEADYPLMNLTESVGGERWKRPRWDPIP